MSANWVKISNAHYVNLDRIDKIRFMQEGGSLTATVWYIFGDQSEMFRDQEARILKAALDAVVTPTSTTEPLNSSNTPPLGDRFSTRLGSGQS